MLPSRLSFLSFSSFSSLLSSSISLSIAFMRSAIDLVHLLKEDLPGPLLRLVHMVVGIAPRGPLAFDARCRNSTRAPWSTDHVRFPSHFLLR